MACLLITVIDREITTEKCKDIEEAQDKMRAELEQYADLDYDDYRIEEDGMSAWANVSSGDMECDWQIVVLD